MLFSFQPIPLGEVQVRDAARRGEFPGSGYIIRPNSPPFSDDMAFRLMLPYPRGGDTIALRANSIRDCQLWMDAINRATHKCKEAEKRSSRKIGSSATYT